MLFKDTIFWKNYSKYDCIIANSSMRSTADAIVYWRLLTTFNFVNFLEIGVYQGLTTGLFFDANKLAIVDAIDPVNKLDLFQIHYKDFLDQFNFFQQKSSTVTLNKEYDFVLIDGDHSYNGVVNDINTVFPLLKSTSVIAFDDWRMPGVQKALDEFRERNCNWVPFLRAEQTEFWHHRSINRSKFLDGLFTDSISNFMFISNIVNGYGDTVCEARTVRALTDYPNLFNQALEIYNI